MKFAIRERCSCGAEFEISLNGWGIREVSDVVDHLSDFRDRHDDHPTKAEPNGEAPSPQVGEERKP